MRSDDALLLDILIAGRKIMRSLMIFHLLSIN